MAEIDISQLEAFRDSLSKRADWNDFVEANARELAARFLRKVIKRTPVGDGTFEYEPGDKKLQRLTNGGTLRRGWTVKTEEEASGGWAPSAMAHAATLKVSKRGRNYAVTLVNPCHYASYVEYGHRQTPGRFVPAIGKRLKKSWVRGQFMMTKSAKELNKEAPKVIQRRLDAYLREVLNGK